jgi:hypothetical protein
MNKNNFRKLILALGVLHFAFLTSGMLFSLPIIWLNYELLGVCGLVIIFVLVEFFFYRKINLK